jgi:hypothetical protein
MMQRLAVGAALASLGVLAAFLAWGNDFLCARSPELGRADLAVVLAGPPEEDRERVLVAADLVEADEARFLLLPLRHRALEWPWFVRTYRVRARLPEERVLIGREEKAKSTSWLDLGGTFAEAKKTLEIMRQGHFRSAIIVSSTYHMRRARLAFERARQDPSLVFYFHAVDARDSEDSQPWWLDGGYAIKVAGEYVKLLAGYLFYR